MRILIAEDERITRRSLQRQLEGWGYDVVAAEDGAAAWDRFQEERFDIVVTDWDMPRMDGRQLIEHIRKSERSGYVYLIMLTGRSEKADLVSGMEAGADDFLAKPFDKNELRVRLNAGERIIRLERELASQNEALQSANRRMGRDLEAAAEMQRDLLPKDVPDALRANFAWYYEPCDELGGDILNVLPLNDQYISIYLLDVAGHGVPAALLSVTLSRVLAVRESGSSIILRQDGRSAAPTPTPPADVVHRLNRQFPMQGQGGRFFTMVYALLDTQTGQLRYANAGHPPPLLVRGGQTVEPLTEGNMPVGVLDVEEYRDHGVSMKPGDRLYFYSDGITEAANSEKKMLDIEGLIELVGQVQELGLKEGLDALVAELKRWCDPVLFADDISMLAIEIRPSN